MTLHEAIEKTIRKNNRPMSAVEIAAELNQSKLYVKQDRTPIKSSQIGARVKNYPQWFTKQGSLIGLYSGRLSVSPSKKTTAASSVGLVNRNAVKVANPGLSEKVLLNPKNFRSASTIDNVVPNQPGMYAIRIQNPLALPKLFSDALAERKHNLLYIGIASKSLNKRMLGQELRARGHGTFFRSLGAALGYVPPSGSLCDKANKKNYTFSLADETKIITWIDKNLLINWVAMDNGWDELESQLILNHKPLLNIAKNPYALPQLSALRKKCVDIANSRSHQF